MRKILNSCLAISIGLAGGSVAADFGAEITAPEPLKTNAAADNSDWRPELATDGAGHWVAIWYSLDSLNGTIGVDYDILVARSEDDGVTWTPPEALNTTAGADSGVDTWPHLTTDGAGHWVAVWQSTENLEGSIGTDYDILVSHSADNGATWTDPEALNSYAHEDGFNDYYPRVASDGAGLWLVVWQSTYSLGGTIGFDEDILMSRSVDNGATWTAAEPLNTNASTDDQFEHIDSGPRMTTDGEGHWVAVWRSSNDLGAPTDTDWDLLTARSTDNGTTWTDPAFLNVNALSDNGHDFDPNVATDRAGHWTAVWYSEDDLDGTVGADMDVFVARSTDDGATWTPPAPLNSSAATDSGEDAQPYVIHDGADHWVVVWMSDNDFGGTGTDYDVFAARSPDDGVTWTAAKPLNTNADADTGDDMVPRATPNGFGRWVAVWMSADDLGGTIGPDFDILTARWTLCYLLFEKTDATRIHYCPGPFYLVAGSLSDLASGGDFSLGACLGSFTEDPIADPLGDPPIGDGWYYLARGLDSCPSYGDSSLDPDPRDQLDLGDPCP